MILAIDPGSEKSAVVEWDGKQIISHDIKENVDCFWFTDPRTIVVIEMVASYGMPVGKEVFETCVWIGRFLEYFHSHDLMAERIYRKDVKMHLCGSMKAKDSNIRQALIDRLGVPGTKKAPGVTYEIKADEWQALALAVTFFDTMVKET